MKKFKIATWAVLIGFIIILIYQNQNFFLGKQSLRINLLVADYQTGAIYNLLLFFICFVAGLLLGAYFVLMDRLKYKKKLKTLNAQNDSHLAEIKTLQRELESLQGEVADADAKTVVIPADAQEPIEAQEQQP
jgi:uncharacterized integral membrane protein